MCFVQIDESIFYNLVLVHYTSLRPRIVNSSTFMSSLFRRSEASTSISKSR
jgi:hypothetical protein